MAKSRRTSVRKYHDRVAGRYDQSYDDVFWQWHDALTWDHLKAFLPADANAAVIDLGCGTGKWGAKVLRSGYEVTFLDVSHRMIERARREIAETSGAGRASFVQGDLADLSALPAARFSLAVAFGEPLGCTPAPARAIKQVRRILAPGGVLVATFDNRLAALDFYLQRGDLDELARFLRDGKTHWLTKNADERFPLVTFSPGQVRKLVEGAGFEVLDMIGKTVLPMRHYRALLAESADRRRWAKIEKTLWRDPAAMGRAAHIQVACRVGRGDS